MAKKSEANRYQDKELKELKEDMKEIKKNTGVLNTEYGLIKTDVKWLKCEFKRFRNTIDDLSDIVNKRPTWMVATIFSVLLSALVGLIVFLVTH